MIDDKVRRGSSPTLNPAADNWTRVKSKSRKVMQIGDEAWLHAIPEAELPFRAHKCRSICWEAARHRRGWSQREWTTFAEAIAAAIVRQRDLRICAWLEEQSGPELYWTRQLELLKLPRNKLAMGLDVMATSAAGQRMGVPESESLSSSIAGIFHHFLGCATLTPSGTAILQ